MRSMNLAYDNDIDALQKGQQLVVEKAESVIIDEWARRAQNITL